MKNGNNTLNPTQERACYLASNPAKEETMETERVQVVIKHKTFPMSNKEYRIIETELLQPFDVPLWKKKYCNS